MFSQQSNLRGGPNTHLVEFRAGRMNMIGTMVHADIRKGLVYMYRGDDSLMHFCWKDRDTGEIEDDIIVFPGEYEYKRVHQCTTGRVYVVIFKTSTKRLFYWMQEPKTEHDDSYCRRVNDLINNTAATNSSSWSGNVHNMFNNMSRQQFLQLIGGSTMELSRLRSLLNTMVHTDSETVDTENSTTTSDTTTTSNTLNVSSELSISIAPIEASETASKKSDVTADCILTIRLPMTDQSKRDTIIRTIVTPPFQRALQVYSETLQSANVATSATEFELTPEAMDATYVGNIDDFVVALQHTLPEGVTMNTDEQLNSPITSKTHIDEDNKENNEGNDAEEPCNKPPDKDPK